MAQWMVKKLVKHDVNDCSICHYQDVDSGVYISCGDGRWLCVECAHREEIQKIMECQRKIREISKAITEINDRVAHNVARARFENARVVKE